MAKSFSVVFCAKIGRASISCHQMTDQVKLGTWIKFDARLQQHRYYEYCISSYSIIIPDVLPTRTYEQQIQVYFKNLSLL